MKRALEKAATFLCSAGKKGRGRHESTESAGVKEVLDLLARQGIAPSA